MKAACMLHPRAQAGFNLIELMIAMVLGLLVLGAAIGIFQSNQRTFSANEGQSRIQESARVAFELISRDLRAAGGTACSNLAMPDVEHSFNDEETALLTAPVTGSGSEFTATSGDDSAYPVTAATVNSVTIDKAKLLADNPGFDLTDAVKTGDKLILCNANQLYVVTAGNVGTDTIAFSPSTSVVLTVDPMAPKATVTVARYRSNRWKLSDGNLVVSRNKGADQQVINGVTSFGVTYLAKGGASYAAAPANWSDVIAARVDMTLAGKDKVDGNTVTRNFSNVVSFRSRTP